MLEVLMAGELDESRLTMRKSFVLSRTYCICGATLDA